MAAEDEVMTTRRTDDAWALMDLRMPVVPLMAGSRKSFTGSWTSRWYGDAVCTTYSNGLSAAWNTYPQQRQEGSLDKPRSRGLLACRGGFPLDQGTRKGGETYGVEGSLPRNVRHHGVGTPVRRVLERLDDGAALLLRPGRHHDLEAGGGLSAGF